MWLAAVYLDEVLCGRRLFYESAAALAKECSARSVCVECVECY